MLAGRTSPFDSGIVSGIAGGSFSAENPGIVIGVFVVWYAIYLRCSLVVLSNTNAS